MASFVTLLRFASLVLCTIVVLSFGAFVIEQARGASEHQQQEVSNGPAATTITTSGVSHPGAVHKALDEASSKITSPFAGVISSSSSEWLIRGVELLLALAIYGFGLGFLARTLAVRV